jgi:hypothetical protein
MEAIDIALAIGITGFSAIVLVTSFYSYLKTKFDKLLPICFAFSLFLIKGFFFIWEIYSKSSASTSLRIILALDFVIIILIYIAVAKK